MKTPNASQFKQTDWASDNCPVCMNPLPRNATGRPPVHCSNACKCKAYRQRNDATRNSQPLNKTTRNSKRKKAIVTYIGESGTILKAPVSTSSALTHNEPPVMRTFADFVDFLAG
jgi:hypothetical protein